MGTQLTEKEFQVQTRAAPAGRNVYRDILNKPSLAPAGRQVPREHGNITFFSPSGATGAQNVDATKVLL